MALRNKFLPAASAWAATSLMALLPLLALAPDPAAAQWMWRGPDGRVNASDRPPPISVAEKDILKRPAADARRAMSKTSEAVTAPDAPASGVPASAPVAAPAASAPLTALQKQVLAKKQAAEKAQADKAKAEQERAVGARAGNCRAARTQAATLQSGTRLARTNSNGEREFLDDRARAEELRRAQDVMASDC